MRTLLLLFLASVALAQEVPVCRRPRAGIPRCQVAPIACTESRPGAIYYDTDLRIVCFCNAQLDPLWCRSDNGICYTNLDCGVQ